MIATVLGILVTIALLVIPFIGDRGCCVAWLNVREALITPWPKTQAITAIKAMIEYIKEKG